MNDLQHRILEIYKVIKKICDNNDIRYFAIGGTAIGAERNNGFIPWDDDMDIAIPNTDYDKFLECCKKELPDHLKVFDYKQSQHSLISFYKIHDINTTYLEKATYRFKDYHYGVFVDVMPMYGVPKNIKKYNLTLRILRYMNMAKQHSFSQINSLIKKVFKVAMMPINMFLPRTFWLDRLDKYQSKWGFDSTEHVGETWSIIGKRQLFKRKWFDSFEELKFEDTSIRCCVGNSEMLKTLYRDYLTLPPEEKRVSNHFVTVLDLDNSYEKYDTNGKLMQTVGEEK